MNEDIVSMCTGVQTDPPAVVLILAIGKDQEQILPVKLSTRRAVDEMIEALMTARIAAFGLGVPSSQPLGYRYHWTG